MIHVDRLSRAVPSVACRLSPSNRIFAEPSLRDAQTVSSVAPHIYITATGEFHPPRAMMASMGTPAAHASVAIPARSECATQSGSIALHRNLIEAGAMDTVFRSDTGPCPREVFGNSGVPSLAPRVRARLVHVVTASSRRGCEAEIF